MENVFKISDVYMKKAMIVYSRDPFSDREGESAAGSFPGFRW